MSMWLVTPINKPFRPFGWGATGTTLLRGLTNHGQQANSNFFQTNSKPQKSSKKSIPVVRRKESLTGLQFPGSFNTRWAPLTKLQIELRTIINPIKCPIIGFHWGYFTPIIGVSYNPALLK